MDKKKKALIGIGIGAAGLGALYLFSRGTAGTTEEDTSSLNSYGGFGGGTTEGGIVDPLYNTGGINSILEGINNLNAEQAARQQALMDNYYAMQNVNQYGSAADELADQVSNPQGSATKRTDLENALMGIDLSKDDLNAIYGLEGVASFTTDGTYALNPEAGTMSAPLMTGGAGNYYQPTGKTANITRAGTGSNAVIFANTGSGTKVYTSSGSDITSPMYSGKASTGSAATNAATLVSSIDSAAGNTTTAKTQGGGTTQVNPSASQTNTASNKSNPIVSAATQIGTNVQSAVSAVSSFFGGLFK